MDLSTKQYFECRSAVLAPFSIVTIVVIFHENKVVSVILFLPRTSPKLLEIHTHICILHMHVHTHTHTYIHIHTCKVFFHFFAFVKVILLHLCVFNLFFHILFNRSLAFRGSPCLLLLVTCRPVQVYKQLNIVSPLRLCCSSWWLHLFPSCILAIWSQRILCICIPFIWCSCTSLLLCRSKKVIELGSGYGLAGLVIAMATEALEVVISDGNPQVVDCILLIWS